MGRVKVGERYMSCRHTGLMMIHGCTIVHVGLQGVEFGARRVGHGSKRVRERVRRGRKEQWMQVLITFAGHRRRR